MQRENTELKESLEQSQYLTQKLNKKISFLTDLSSKLKVMAGLPEEGPGKKKIQQQPKAGLGGVTMNSTSLGAPEPGRLIGLEKRTQYLEKTFTLLNNYFQDKNQQLSTDYSFRSSNAGFSFLVFRFPPESFYERSGFP